MTGEDIDGPSPETNRHGIGIFRKAHHSHGAHAARTGPPGARAARAAARFARHHRLYGDLSGGISARGRGRFGMFAVPALPGQRHRLACEPRSSGPHRGRRSDDQGAAEMHLPDRPGPAGCGLLVHARQRPSREARPYAGLGPQDPRRDAGAADPGRLAAGRSRPARSAALLLLDQPGGPPGDERHRTTVRIPTSRIFDDRALCEIMARVGSGGRP